MYRDLSLLRVAFLAGVAMFAGTGCDSRTEPGPEEAEAKASPTKAPVPVAVQLLDTGLADAQVRVWGTVVPNREARILAEITGRMGSVEVGLGDRVQKGDVLLSIDGGLYRARNREAEASLASARAVHKKAARDLERAEALFASTNLSDSELESSRNRTMQAAASLAAAEASLEQARVHLSHAVVRAPFDGQIAMRPPDSGTSVTPGTPLITVVALDPVRIEARISEQDLPFVKTGDEAILNVDGVPGRTFAARVARLGPQADETRQFPVELTASNPDGLLRGGMVARVEIVYQVYENIPLLPVDALLEENDLFVYYTVHDGTAVRREARLGPREGSYIALLEGGTPGDSVVVLGQTRLADGVPVRVEGVH